MNATLRMYIDDLCEVTSRGRMRKEGVPFLVDEQVAAILVLAEAVETGLEKVVEELQNLRAATG